MESMAQFLIKGDTIIDGRKKYEVLNVSTTTENTKILIKDKTISRIVVAENNKFFKIKSAIKLD